MNNEVHAKAREALTNLLEKNEEAIEGILVGSVYQSNFDREKWVVNITVASPPVIMERILDTLIEHFEEKYPEISEKVLNKYLISHLAKKAKEKLK